MPDRDPGRDLSRPVTVVNRFTVKGDPQKFEREFREHSQFLRRQKDFEYLVTVQLVDQPQVYAHLAHWRSLEGFIEVVHAETFLKHVQRLGPMVDTEADQTISVQRVLVQNALEGCENVVLLHSTVLGSRQEFESGIRDLTRHFGSLGGFGGLDLLRSTVRPQMYLGLMWWADTAACDRALASEGFLERRDQLTQVARIDVERTRHIAYERVIND
ncbi:antibiotic biosynthesis monooxygenase family protein [Streptomyces sp. H27-D2]|uniref:antibiotic biosynthesis monooxygenase family protein n=1 Tax=Streptomyces sp. H27-D2 TaxID=3046304 RepID=UPI002DC063A2|nr:hypothetical protein [Streptomyces sp. H27-D2]MEC4017651.1 hypothetical protein [Streptomyces sp. H27-D2]